MITQYNNKRTLAVKIKSSSSYFDRKNIKIRTKQIMITKKKNKKKDNKLRQNKNVGNRAINHNKWMLLNCPRDICACNMSGGFRKIANS